MAKDQKSKLAPEDLQQKEKIRRQHQEVLAQEAKATDEAEKEKLRNQRLALEKDLSDIQKKMQKTYLDNIKDMPTPVPWFKNMVMAFVIGGLICTCSQALNMWFSGKGLDEKMANAAVISILIVITGILTGIGIFDEIGRRAGAGTIVPVTGFANSIVSAALEFKKEGFIYGVGYKLFTVAGPVVVYGTVVSAIIGIVYFFMGAK
ncbi:MAG: SpoVA/SpoVAEb family sporulation membrane protein [Clostridiales bacterium]